MSRCRRPLSASARAQMADAKRMTAADRVMAGHRLDGTYPEIYLPWHPRARGGTGYVREHVVIAERKLGRFIASTEPVHHINGDTRDNRPENLHVCADNAEHRRLHARAA